MDEKIFHNEYGKLQIKVENTSYDYYPSPTNSGKPKTGDIAKNGWATKNRFIVSMILVNDADPYNLDSWKPKKELTND